jgi:hypothetical protein
MDLSSKDGDESGQSTEKQDQPKSAYNLIDKGFLQKRLHERQ